MLIIIKSKMSFLKKNIFRLLILIIKPLKLIIAYKLNIKEFKNYSNSFILIDKLSNNSVAIDVGCAQDADFSKLINNKYKSKCYGIDPTLKHRAELLKLEQNSNNLFKYLQYAISKKDEKIVFYESQDNQSGSLLSSHVNVRNDNIIEYEVQGIRLISLFSELNLMRIDILKLDIEGAEYELLAEIKENDLEIIDQLFIEFHHHAIPEFTSKDTYKLVKKIEKLGFNYFTFDYHNYLFYR